MSMRVVGILASPKGKNSQTAKLAEAFAEGAKAAGSDVELIDVCRLKIEYCRACDACHRSGRCIHKDDFAGLRESLLKADGIMWSSPNYFRTVTAQLKTMIDRMSDTIHCQLLSGKYACSLSTSGGPGCDEATRYLDEILISMGAYVVGNVALSVGRGPEGLPAAVQKARALGQDLCAAIAAKRVIPEQCEAHERNAAYFRRLIGANKDRWPHEYQYWSRAPQS